MFGDSVGSGVATVAFLTITYIVLAFVIVMSLPHPANALGGISVFVLGVTQLIYLVPLYFRWRKTKADCAKGLIIGGCIVALLNVACDGVLPMFIKL